MNDPSRTKQVPTWVKTGAVGAVCLIVGMVIATSFTMGDRGGQEPDIEARTATQAKADLAIAQRAETEARAALAEAQRAETRVPDQPSFLEEELKKRSDQKDDRNEVRRRLEEAARKRQEDSDKAHNALRGAAEDVVDELVKLQLAIDTGISHTEYNEAIQELERLYKTFDELYDDARIAIVTSPVSYRSLSWHLEQAVDAFRDADTSWNKREFWWDTGGLFLLEALKELEDLGQDE